MNLALKIMLPCLFPFMLWMFESHHITDLYPPVGDLGIRICIAFLTYLRKKTKMFAVSGMMAMFFGKGFIFGLLSVALPSLRKPDSGVKLTLEQESWIASIYFLMCFPTKCITGYVIEKYGRKCVIVLALIPILIANMMMYLANNFTILLTSMMVFGLSGGGATGSVMAAEISTPKYRGFLLNARFVLHVIGSMIPHFFGKFFNWRALVLWNCVPAVYGLVVSVTCPESPAWLAAQGRFEECKTAFIWYRGNDEDAELQQLIHSQRKALLEKQSEKHKNRSNVTRMIKYLCDKCFLKAAVLGFISVIMFEAFGKYLFALYIIDLFVVITGDKGSANYFALAMDLQIFVCMSITCFSLIKFKRRALLFGTGIPAVLILSSLCLFSFLMSKGFISEKYSWIKLALLLAFFLMRDLGILPVVQALTAEVYPLSHRGLGVSIDGLVYAILTFTFAKTLPIMLKGYGLQVFLINAVVISLCLIYLYLFLPESSDKTLIDIENEIKGHTNKDYSACNLDAENISTFEKQKK